MGKNNEKWDSAAQADRQRRKVTMTLSPSDEANIAAAREIHGLPSASYATSVAMRILLRASASDVAQAKAETDADIESLKLAKR